MTGVKAQAEALLRPYDEALRNKSVPLKEFVIAKKALEKEAPTLARQVVELAEEVERLHNRVRMLEYDNDGHLEMLGELHGELPDGATKETLGRLLRDWGTASDQSAYVPRAVLAEALTLLRAAQSALEPYMRVIPGTGEPGVLNEAAQVAQRISTYLAQEVQG